MSDKVKIFDQLRKAMRIAQPSSKKGLNDDGDDSDIQTIEKRVRKFRQSPKLQKRAKTDVSYQKMILQIDRYWEKLFTDPIQVSTSLGILTIQPQRTNNIMERFFRDVNRYGRQKSGSVSLNKTLKAMIADTPLVKNLENQQYLKILLNGKSHLEECFAEIDAQLLNQEFKRKSEEQKLLPSKTKEIGKISDLPSKLNTHNQ